MAIDYTKDANCQGAWLFDDNLLDVSGKGNTLTAVGGTPDYQIDRPTGHVVGKSIHFNGSSQALSIANADKSANFLCKSGYNAEDWAVSLWFKKDDNGSDYEVLFAQDANTLQMEFNLTNRLIAYAEDSGNDGYVWDNIYNFTAWGGAWVHVCISFDGSIQTCTIYLSNVSFGDLANGTPRVFTNVDNVRGNTSAWYFGCWLGTDDWFDGYLYQPIIFNRTLSAVEAEELYTVGAYPGASGAVGSSLFRRIALRSLRK